MEESVWVVFSMALDYCPPNFVFAVIDGAERRGATVRPASGVSICGHNVEVEVEQGSAAEGEVRRYLRRMEGLSRKWKAPNNGSFAENMDRALAKQT